MMASPRNNRRHGRGFFALLSLIFLLFTLIGIVGSARLGGVEQEDGDGGLQADEGTDIPALDDKMKASLKHESQEEDDFNREYDDELWDYEDDEEEEDHDAYDEDKEEDDLEPVWGIEQKSNLKKESPLSDSRFLSFHAASENAAGQKSRGLLQAVSKVVTNGFGILRYLTTGRVDFAFTSPDTGDTWNVQAKTISRKSLHKYKRKCGRYNYRVYFFLFRQSLGVHVRPVNPYVTNSGCNALNFYSAVEDPSKEWEGQPLRKKTAKLFSDGPPSSSVSDTFLRFLGTRKFRDIAKAFATAPARRPDVTSGYNAASNGAGTLPRNVFKNLGFPPATESDVQWMVDAMVRWEAGFAQELVDAGLEVPDFMRDNPDQYQDEIFRILVTPQQRPPRDEL